MTGVNLRPASMADLSTLKHLEAHPRIAEWQYLPSPLMQDFLQKVLSGFDFPGYEVRIHVIEIDGGIVGFISHTHWRQGAFYLVTCGWSLLPECWGQGIMSRSLRQLFDSFFADQVDYVFADYFHGNHRCQRLLQKLGFATHVIPWLERCRKLWATRHFVWLHRMYLDRARWLELRGQKSSAQEKG